MDGTFRGPLLALARALGAMLAAFLVAGAAFAQQSPLRIGFGMSLTGPLGGNGTAAVIAMELWRDDVNAKGGLLGRKVEFVYYDDQTNPATVPAIYTKLLDVDRVDLVVSGYGTNVIAPAMPIMMQRKLTFMSLFGLNVNEKFKYDRYFQIMPAGPNPAMALFPGVLRHRDGVEPQTPDIALVGADAQPHLALEGARAHAKKAGLKIVYDKTYPPKTVDYAPIVRAIQATNPDLVFVASYPPDSVGMVRAANEVGLKTRMFGGGLVGPQFAALRSQLGPLLNGVVNYEFYVPELRNQFPDLQRFLAKYQVRALASPGGPAGFLSPALSPTR